MTILNELEWFYHYFYNTKNLCNAYLFSSTNSDYFEVEPFSGNFKMIVAAESEGGINPDIVSGRVGDFVPTVDYQDPKWVEYDISLTGENLVDNDNPSSVGSQWSHLGSGRWEYLGDGSWNPLVLVSPSNQPDFIEVNFTIESITGEMVAQDYSGESFSAPGSYTIYIDVSSGNSQVFKRSHGVCECVISNVSIKSYSELTVVVDDTFNGVIAKYAKDDVWYNIDMGVDVVAIEGGVTYNTQNVTYNEKNVVYI